MANTALAVLCCLMIILITVPGLYSRDVREVKHMTTPANTTEFLNMMTYAELDGVPPDGVDWRRARGVISGIKHQGPCGSCWAFAAVAAIEYRIRAVRQRTVQPLSTQQLLDCVACEGCNGSFVDWAYHWMVHANHGGLRSEDDYGPYTGVQRECRYGGPKRITSHCQLPSPVSEDLLKKYVAQGPVAVYMDGSSEGFYNYDGGIFYGPCSYTFC